MRKALALSAAATLALAAPGAAVNLEIGGYIDVGWFDVEGGGTGAVGLSADPAAYAVGSTNGAQTTAGQQTSTVNEVNVDLTAELADNVTVFASLDAIPTGGRGDGSANGGTATLDLAYIDFQNPGAMPINVRVGAIPSVIGIEQREAESNQKRTISLSLLSPFTVGSVVGMGVYGSFDFINYQVAWANTDPFGAGAAFTDAAGAAGAAGTLNAGQHTATALGSLRPNNNGVTGADFDNNRTIQGRVGVTPLEGLEIGVSGTFGDYAVKAAGVDRERRSVGFDVGYVWGPWSVKGEFLTIDEDNTVNARANDSQGTGWYIEGGYEFGSIASIARSGGLVLRYGEFDVDVDGDGVPGTLGSVQILDVSQLAVAGYLDLSSDVRLKAEWQSNDEDGLLNAASATVPRDIENDVFALSAVASF